MEQELKGPEHKSFSLLSSLLAPVSFNRPPLTACAVLRLPNPHSHGTLYKFLGYMAGEASSALI